MGRKKVVFLIGTAHEDVAKTKKPVTDQEWQMFVNVAEKLDVDFHVILAMPDLSLAGVKTIKMGRHYKAATKRTPERKPEPGTLRYHRPDVLEDIKACKPDVLMVCGPVAMKLVSDRGNFSVRDHLRERLEFPDFPELTCVATHSLTQIAAKPGVEKWLWLDTMAAVNGMVDTDWGEYFLVLPDVPSPELKHLLKTKYKTMTYTTKWNAMPKELVGCKQAGFDLETFPGLDPWHPEARIRMAVVSDKLGRAWIIQAKPDSTFPAWVTGIAKHKKTQCGGSNIKFDYKWMDRFGYTITNMWDTSTAQHVLDPTDPFTDLKSLTFLHAPQLGDYSKGHRQMVAERGGWEFVEDYEQYDYCGADGEASVAAMLAQQQQLEAAGLSRPASLSMALYDVLAKMETAGAKVSKRINTRLDNEFGVAITQIRDEILQHLGPINPNSTTQLVEALQKAVPGIKLAKPKIARQLSDKWYKLPSDEKEPDAYSTEKSILEREAHKHPVVAKILLYRRLDKLYSTYVTSLQEKFMVSHGGREDYYVHTSYRPDVAETYRLSSQAPNMQNIPRKPEPDDPYPIPTNLNIKLQYTSRFGARGRILEADLSQAEIRIAAHLCQDANLLEAVHSQDDLHTRMAGNVHSIDMEDVTKLQRTHIKKTTFGIIYLMTSTGLSKQLGITKGAAKILQDTYFNTYPGLYDHIEQVKDQVKRDLFSESIFGYRRLFREPLKWNAYPGWRIERQAWNHKVQNPAACCVFAAMIDIQKEFELRKMKSVLFGQVHDSVLVDVYPRELPDVAEITKNCMENPDLERWGVKLTVPLTADIEVGKSWGTKKPYIIK